MTRYLLDTSVFVEAHQRFYAMDFCPGFWNWIEVMRSTDRIVCVQRVFNELCDFDDSDELKKWAIARGRGWFLPDNEQMANSQGAVSEWVNNTKWPGGLGYSQSSMAKFFGSGADQFLVAYAKGNGLTLVTQESPCRGPSEVKLPTVCAGVGVPCITLFGMLRAERVVMRMCGKEDCSSDCHRSA